MFFNLQEKTEFEWNRSGKRILKKYFQNFLKSNNFKHYSRNTSLGAVFVGRFVRTIGDLFKRPVFELSDDNLIDLLPIKTKQYCNRVHCTIKLTLFQASLKKNESHVYQNLSQKRIKIESKFGIHNFVRTADMKKIFSKRHMTNWSYILYEITEFFLIQYRVIALIYYPSVMMKPWWRKKTRINIKRER